MIDSRKIGIEGEKRNPRNAKSRGSNPAQGKSQLQQESTYSYEQFTHVLGL